MVRKCDNRGKELKYSDKRYRTDDWKSVCAPCLADPHQEKEFIEREKI